MTATATLDAPVLIGRFEPLSPEWHAARLNGIGGSEIAAVLGLSRFESRFSLWHRKAGRLAPETENDEMEAGNRLEPAICQKFADSHPELVIMPAGTYRSAERPWQIANPDRIVYVRGEGEWQSARPAALLEAKFALYDDEWGEPGTDEIPPYYQAQARHYLDVFGLATCYVEVFIGSCAQFREYVVHPDPDDTATLRAAGEQFMADLAAGRRPDIDAHTATYQAVRELHPDIDQVDLELNPATARQYLDALTGYRDAKAAKTLACSAVADELGTARRATFLGKPLALRVRGQGDNPPFLRPARGVPEETTS